MSKAKEARNTISRMEIVIEQLYTELEITRNVLYRILKNNPITMDNELTTVPDNANFRIDNADGSPQEINQTPPDVITISVREYPSGIKSRWQEVNERIKGLGL